MTATRKPTAQPSKARPRPTTRPVGRPPAAGEPRSERVELRVTRSEHDAIIAAGGSEWVRGLVREALNGATKGTKTPPKGFV